MKKIPGNVTWKEVKPRSPPKSKRFEQGRTGYHRAIRAEQRAEKIRKGRESTRLSLLNKSTQGEEEE